MLKRLSRRSTVPVGTEQQQVQQNERPGSIADTSPLSAKALGNSKVSWSFVRNSPVALITLALITFVVLAVRHVALRNCSCARRALAEAGVL
jgi:hypothetical protein